MKILIDMNLSPSWKEALQNEGFEALHWYEVGNPKAADTEIVAWAYNNQYCVLTHDLDFGIILALTKAVFPSVIQMRTQDVTPQQSKERLVKVFRQFQSEIEKGALITIDQERERVRILPFSTQQN